MEKSYWSFVETHPAHRSTSERDRDEAMEFLAWCLADQLVLVDGEQGTNYPFTLAQCRELMDLIRSVDGMMVRHNAGHCLRMFFLAQMTRHTDGAL